MIAGDERDAIDEASQTFNWGECTVGAEPPGHNFLRPPARGDEQAAVPVLCNGGYVSKPLFEARDGYDCSVGANFPEGLAAATVAMPDVEVRVGVKHDLPE